MLGGNYEVLRLVCCDWTYVRYLVNQELHHQADSSLWQSRRESASLITSHKSSFFQWTTLWDTWTLPVVAATQFQPGVGDPLAAEFNSSAVRAQTRGVESHPSCFKRHQCTLEGTRQWSRQNRIIGRKQRCRTTECTVNQDTCSPPDGEGDAIIVHV